MAMNPRDDRCSHVSPPGQTMCECQEYVEWMRGVVAVQDERIRDLQRRLIQQGKNPEPTDPPKEPGGLPRRRCYMTMCDWPHQWEDKDTGETFWCGSYA